MAEPKYEPRRMRVKTDELAADPDWAGTNVRPTEPVGGAAIVRPIPITLGADFGPVKSVWVKVIGTDATGAPLNPSRGATTSFDLQIVEVVQRRRRDTGLPNSTEVVVDVDVTAGCTLNRWYRFPVRPGMAEFAIRQASVLANPPAGIDRTEFWYAFAND